MEALPRTTGATLDEPPPFLHGDGVWAVGGSAPGKFETINSPPNAPLERDDDGGCGGDAAALVGVRERAGNGLMALVACNCPLPASNCAKAACPGARAESVKPWKIAAAVSWACVSLRRNEPSSMVVFTSTMASRRRLMVRAGAPRTKTPKIPSMRQI